MIMFLNN